MLVAEKISENKENNWLNQLRSAAFARFNAKGFPTKKDEAWKYTSFGNIKKEILTPALMPVSNSGKAVLQSPLADHYQVTIIDGVVADEATQLPTDKSINIGKLEDLVDRENIAEKIQEGLVDSDPFNQLSYISLNTANASDAIVITIEENVTLDKPLEIHNIVSGTISKSVYSQVFVFLSTNSQLKLIERFYGDDLLAADTNCFGSHVVRINLAENSNLKHYRISTLPDNIYHLYAADIKLGSNSEYKSFSVSTGGAVVKQEIYAELNGSNIKCDQQGIVLVEGRQHHDMYLPVLHNAPGSYSNQHFRQVLDDHAKGIFYGSVRVPAGSEKTEAHQLNKNLLLNPAAQVFTRPELDIYTDDVICSHGATTGNLDETAIYYLQARGLSREQAITFLLEGFLVEMTENIEDEKVREYLENLISK